MVCKRAAPAWTAGSDTHCGEGIRQGSSVSSVSESLSVLTLNRSLGFKMFVPGSGKSKYGCNCGPRVSTEAYRGMLAISEEKLENGCCVRFQL